MCAVKVNYSSVFQCAVYGKIGCVAAFHHTEHSAYVTFAPIVACIGRNLGVLYAVNGVVAVIEASVERYFDMVKSNIVVLIVIVIVTVITNIAYHAACIYVVTLSRGIYRIKRITEGVY